MSAFDLLTARLDQAPDPVTFFFRDDDAGWADEALLALCDRFRGKAPLDLAVIPCAVKSRLVDELLARADGLAFHQHGFAHINHQREGRKCEFGPDRPTTDAARDLFLGRRLLLDMFADRLDPVFTPPWNRCTADTALTLAELGIEVLSRDRSASSIAAAGLVELPVAVDWVRHRERLDQALARASVASPVGVMLHHEVLGSWDHELVDELLALLDRHRNARVESMMTLARQVVAP
ncbi:MAG: hypothetical protein ACE5GB_09830 [Acidimicrobiales bacterium]